MPEFVSNWKRGNFAYKIFAGAVQIEGSKSIYNIDSIYMNCMALYGSWIVEIWIPTSLLKWSIQRIVFNTFDGSADNVTPHL